MTNLLQNTLVWSDEFNGDKIDESKWQIIDGMWNHAAIYNRKAVSIKKDGDKSYLSIRSTNHKDKKALVEAVGHDRYDDKELPDKVTWQLFLQCWDKVLCHRKFGK